MILSVKQICSARAETKHMMKRNFLVENAAAVLRIFDSISCIDPRRKMIASSSETAALLEKEAFSSVMREMRRSFGSRAGLRTFSARTFARQGRHAEDSAIKVPQFRNCVFQT